MNILDILVVFTSIFCALLGSYWGLIRQVLAITGLLVGITIAGSYGPVVAAWLSSFMPNAALAGALGFILVLTGFSAFASLIASLLHRYVGLLFLGWLDQLLGGMLGLLQALLASAVVLVVLVAYSLITWDTLVNSSWLADPLLRLSLLITPLLREDVRQAIQAALTGM
jgi:membrane protein required for colicin V production